MTKSNEVLLQELQDQLLGKYFNLLEIYNELGSVLYDIEDIKDTVKHKYDLIQLRQDLREEEMQTIVDLLKSIGYDVKLLP